VSLTLAFGSNRPGSGEIVNDGTLALDGAASLTQLLSKGDLTLSGSGTLALSDSVQNRVATTAGEATLANEAGHRIEGAGTLEAYRIENRGTIAVTGTNPLVLTTSSLLNEGTFEANGAGGFDLGSVSFSNQGLLRVHSGSSAATGYLANYDTVEIFSGGRLASTSSLRNERAGMFRVSGAGSEASFASSISNYGLLEVLDGGRVSASNLFHSSGSALTRIASGGELVLTGSNSSLREGILELDGGTLTSSYGVTLYNNGTSLVGNGLLALPGQTLSVGSSALLSPGLGGPGLLEIDGSLSFYGRLLAEIGGTALADYDRINVTEQTLVTSDYYGNVGIEISFLDGFLPSLGDAFDLITAQTLTSSVPLSQLFGACGSGCSKPWRPPGTAETAATRIRSSGASAARRSRPRSRATTPGTSSRCASTATSLGSPPPSRWEPTSRSTVSRSTRTTRSPWKTRSL